MAIRRKDELDDIFPLVRKPARYIGGEWNQCLKTEFKFRVALAYPDIYEVGMSNIGLQILYEIINDLPDCFAERVYAPWADMEEQLRRRRLPLFSLETRTPIADFDMLGFTLQHELTYTNVLNMLDLAGLPLEAAERSGGHPLVIAGGPGALNPEPMAEFIDLFVIGEGEDVVPEIFSAYRQHEADFEAGKSGRDAFIKKIASIDGVYAPRFAGGGGNRGAKSSPSAGFSVSRRIATDFASRRPPRAPIVPFLETIHDRSVIEVMRGCSRGCRFCQAGVVYRPVRERPVDLIVEAAAGQGRACGFDEVSLASLSSTDHSRIMAAIESLAAGERFDWRSISLPSLRTDRFSVELAEKIAGLKRTGLTFAPEAGTERLRRVINKGISESDLLETAKKAFGTGWSRIKLYFMIGLPTETMEDLAGLVDLVGKVLAAGDEVLGRAGRGIKVTVSVSCFIPKPHSPFQWAGALGLAEILKRQQFLKTRLRDRRVDYKWHEATASIVEAAIARGDRRTGPAIREAYKRGARFDGWSDQFNYDYWRDAFEAAGMDVESEATRIFSLAADLPWDHINVGVEREWLADEYDKALRGESTPDCRYEACSVCGLCDAEVGPVIQDPAPGSGAKAWLK